MVPIIVAEKVDEVGEVITRVVCMVPEPEASAKRPVPPVIVKETVSWNTFWPEPGQERPLPAIET
jgi:hypothetical protein